MDVRGPDNTWRAVTFAPPKSPGKPGSHSAVSPWPLEATVPPKLLALRIQMPAKGCVVEDAYRTPDVAGGKLLWNPNTGVFVTQVQMAAAHVFAESKSRWLVRAMRIRGTQ